MSASLVEKHFDSVHVSIEFLIDAISKCLALLLQLVLELAYFVVCSNLHRLNFLELLFKVGKASFHVNGFHWCITIRWLGDLLDLLVQIGFHGGQLCMSDWIALRLRQNCGRLCGWAAAVFPPWVIMGPRVISLQVVKRLLGGNEGKGLGLIGWSVVMDLSDQDIAMLQSVYPMPWILNSLYVPSDTTSVLGPSLRLKWTGVPFPSFQ